MSEYACIVVDSVGRKRFELCRALRHVPKCKGATVALAAYLATKAAAT